MAKAFDISTPQRRAALTRNLVNMYDYATPAERQEGREWYPKVHEATMKGADKYGIDHLSASGLVAAVSPNMDFDKVNIDAFSELTQMSGKQWDAVHRSAAAEGGRLPSTAKALKGLGVSRATDGALIKAHRILSGDHVDDVLNRRTAPKTNSFAWNIHDLDDNTRVTIDGRQHDVMTNRLRGWTDSSRGISSASLPTGGTTRYEHFENAAINAAALRDERRGADVQAISWITGKRREKELAGGLLTKAGTPRQVGVARRGQRYF